MLGVGCSIFSIFPNPAQDYFTIDYSTGESFINLEVEIKDVTGRVLQRIVLKGGNNVELIDTRQLLSGIYLVSLKGDGLIISSEKLIVRK